MPTLERRYDIDWIRVIAIWLLLIYHTAIGFQPWGLMIGFITNAKPWTALWTPMAMLNVWRIPLLFFVSGMGVYFTIQNRSWKELLLERATRILVPFIFGTFCIVPIHIYIMSAYYGNNYHYSPYTGHLWFLGNIVVYIILFTPLFYYLKRNENKKLPILLKRLFALPTGLLIVFAFFTIEVVLVKPQPYEFYVMNLHGFSLGLLAFLFGFCFMYSGNSFWEMIVKWRWLFLVIGASLFTFRMYELQQNMSVTSYLLPTESICWILCMFAFGKRHLNKPSKSLRYLSQAAYPVYVLHMIFLYLGSTFIFKLELVAPIQFFFTLIFTFICCYATFEIIRRIKVLRFLFGLSPVRQNIKLEVSN